MLFNFCDPRLRPEIKCSSISTEGYEVTNLISDSCKGFLAYSCIKPPIHIDITFLCNIQINRILIWPSVGSQKSSGFQLYSKSTNDENTPYTLLSNGFLNSCDAGLLFYPADIDIKKITAPANFLKRYIKVSMRYLTTYTHSLRITICKTENSVPALARIEVWGTVSPRCGKDVVASVHSLWSKHQTTLGSSAECKSSTRSANIPNNVTNRQENQTTLEVPEHFLDPITYEIMTQPIILPSGKIIDQTTLEKHEQNEAIWGRPVSDPFTAIPFNEERRPVMATALKLRIDKFLLENSNLDEIKNMPRVLGRASSSVIMRDRRIIEIPKCVLNKNSLKRTNEDAKLNVCKQIVDDSQRTKRYCHQLPAVVTCPKRTTANSKPKQVAKNLIASSLTDNNSRSCNSNNISEILPTDVEIISDNRINAPCENTNIKRFSTSEKVELHNILNNCECCSSNILYRLPCKHVICRKILLSIENSQCNSCGLSYKSSDVERIHDSILSR